MCGRRAPLQIERREGRECADPDEDRRHVEPLPHLGGHLGRHERPHTPHRGVRERADRQPHCERPPAIGLELPIAGDAIPDRGAGKRERDGRRGQSPGGRLPGLPGDAGDARREQAGDRAAAHQGEMQPRYGSFRADDRSGGHAAGAARARGRRLWLMDRHGLRRRLRNGDRPLALRAGARAACELVADGEPALASWADDLDRHVTTRTTETTGAIQPRVRRRTPGFRSVRGHRSPVKVRLYAVDFGQVSHVVASMPLAGAG